MKVAIASHAKGAGVTLKAHSHPKLGSVRPVVVRQFANRMSTLQPVSASTSAPAETVAGSVEPFNPTKPTLFDVPVSNNGARVRYIIYKKGLEGVIDIKKPTEIGGLKSEAYLALNPQGKMPLLALPDGSTWPESQVIESYLLDKYKGTGPDLVPGTCELRALCSLTVRILDIYICSIQGCMYKPMDSAEQRAAQLSQINYQLDVLEKLVIGPFVAGEQQTHADGALLPTFVFMVDILPKHFGWGSVFTRRPKLQAWWNAMSNDDVGKRIIDEVSGGIAFWESNQRWETTGIAKQVADGSYNWSCDN